ncbi:MAG: CDP-alcohol phosphatidyltransferase family protein [Candidatus Rokubacteria bacterium]|nr:CDP-alcohol phosphatidyltransferase family protein [Candidatus Rokubacteria bacterium]
MSVQTSTGRRPIKARETRGAQALARWLTRAGACPNQISLLSIVFAGLAGLCLILSRSGADAGRIALLLAAALLIQLRLLANLLDGMVAIEGGLRTSAGEVVNEFPDRLSDVVILVCAGYSVTAVEWGPTLGWAAAVLAVLTAYVRALGASLGTAQYFCGPMAKPQRMAATTLACLLSGVEIIRGWPPLAMPVALGVIMAGSMMTVSRRIIAIATELEGDRRC